MTRSHNASWQGDPRPKKLAPTARIGANCVKRHVSDCSSTLCGNNQALTRQRFVLVLDQITVALSNFAALNRVGFEFICVFIALPSLREPPAFRAQNIHGTSLRFRTVVLVSPNLAE